MTHPPSRLYLSDIRHSVPCKFRALTILVASPRCNASYPLPVRQASALPSASSRFAVTRDTLAVQLTLPLAGRVEDFHLQVPAGRTKKKGAYQRTPTPTERQNTLVSRRLKKPPHETHCVNYGVATNRHVDLDQQTSTPTLAARVSAVHGGDSVSTAASVSRRRRASMSPGASSRSSINSL